MGKWLSHCPGIFLPSLFHPIQTKPGPGYSKHLTATISGNVTVNSLTYINPTTISLNLSTVNANFGLQNVTITNPDRQFATASNLIDITCMQKVGNLAPDGAAGSLRQAIEAVDQPGGCRVISLEDISDPIILDRSLILPQEVTITTNKPCSAGKVEIDGGGYPADGLTLNGGIFFGLYVHGFTGSEIVANSGNNRLNCIKAART